IGKSLDGVITSWNRGAEKIYGYAAAEAVGRHISFLAAPDGQDDMTPLLKRIEAGEHVKHLETLRLTKEGRSIFVSITLSPIFGAGGRVIGVSTIARDISERRQLELLLRENEARYRTQVELATDAVIVHQEGCFVY